MFDAHVLDMMELRIEEYTPISAFKGTKPPCAPRMSFAFVGSAFETSDDLKMFKNMLVDFYHNDAQSKYCLDEFTSVMSVVADQGKVFISVFAVTLKNGATATHEVGPRLVLVPGRTKFATEDHRQEAMRAPAQLAPAKKVKNVTKDFLGQKHGVVHVNAQKLADLNKGIKRMKALRVSKKKTRLSK